MEGHRDGVTSHGLPQIQSNKDIKVGFYDNLNSTFKIHRSLLSPSVAPHSHRSCKCLKITCKIRFM